MLPSQGERDGEGGDAFDLGPDPGTAGDGRGSRQVAALAAAWGRGERLTAAEILERHPDLDDEAAIRLIYEETCLRREAGLEADTSEVVRRHPRWADDLRALFDCDRMFRTPGADRDFPEVGETLGPFRLLAELGRGASGRTFLATDPGLADRPVVVKVIPNDQEEHLALARLRHTHIVPLFSEHSFPGRGLRVLCMPFLGGASLAEVLRGMACIPPAQRSGKLLVELIDRNTRAAPTPAEAPFRRSLEQASYVKAVTWIAACLADALHYAHARGFVHMDVKPSNVLITADGQPMLLDFHLARAPILPGEWVVDRLGGTPGWMAPEQQSAMAAVTQGRAVPALVDGRADIYALGLLLREALAAPGGPLPDGPHGVSVGLGDVIRKCVAPDPSARYADAAALAEDLRRHINDLPLKGVANRSPAERWRKWRRRHPGAPAWLVAGLALTLAVAGGLAVALAAHGQAAGRLRMALEDGRSLRASGRYDEAIRALRRGLEAERSVLPVDDLAGALAREMDLARRGQFAATVHARADLVRSRYGFELPSPKDGRDLAAACREIWEQRGRLLPAADPTFGPGFEAQVKTDLIELAAVWADLRVRLAPPSQADAARREALEILDQADAAYGPSLALDLRRETLAPEAVAGRDETAPAPSRAHAPRSAWEHYDLGRYFVRAGRLEAAAVEFRKALALKPQDFWANFYRGSCAFRLGRLEDAVAAFGTCIALVPDSPDCQPQSAVCHYNRALARDALGRADEAFEDYTGAIERDPGLAAAFLNRGILSYKAGRHLEAIADFEHALHARPDRATLGRLHCNLALAQLARGDRAAARENAEEAARLGCREAEPLAERLR